MAKAIKEMADEYAHNRYSVRSNILFASECYEDGANAVLEEVERVYQKEGAFGVIQLIKQLKEEL